MKTKSGRSHFQCEFRTYNANGVLQYEKLDFKFTAACASEYVKRRQALYTKHGYTAEFKNIINLDE